VLLAPGLSLSSGALAQLIVAPPEVLIEGHVFNKRTGVPLEGAIIAVATPGLGLPRITPESPRTDTNGFYSIVINNDHFFDLFAICNFETENGDPRSARSHAIINAFGRAELRRDFYVDARPNRRFTKCDPQIDPTLPVQ
jgi:hypothetical protein